jgi:hypothetical protein
MSDLPNFEPTIIEVRMQPNPQRPEFLCELVAETKSTIESQPGAPSLPGFQRQITEYLIGQGYRPQGSWQTTATDAAAEPVECVRMFLGSGGSSA